MPGMQLDENNISNYQEPAKQSGSEKQQVLEDDYGKTTKKAEYSVHDLKGRVCYFSLAGDLALKAYKELALSSIRKEQRTSRLKRDVQQRLYYSVLMFDMVTMHCSDPLRSEIVLEILTEHRDWVEKGRIAFIYASNIYNVQTDYKKYIQRKIEEYKELDAFCEPEMRSLMQEHMTEKYYNDVIALLDASDYIIRKPMENEYKFTNFVKNDLNPEVRQIIISSKSSEKPAVDASVMTLYQLMNMVYADKSTGKLESVFPETIIEEVLETIEEHLDQGIMVARSAIVSMIQDRFKTDGEKLTRLQKNVLKAITLRMDILYCKMNSGQCLILEFHPSYEPHSSYQIDHFTEFCRQIGDKGKKFDITKEIIDQILVCSKNEIRSFRECYLACVSDARELMRINGIKDSFSVAMRNNDVTGCARENFKRIANILEGKK